jgi:hypothetical protein
MVGTAAVHLSTLTASPDVTRTAKKRDLHACGLAFFDNGCDLTDKIKIQNIIHACSQRFAGQLEQDAMILGASLFDLHVELLKKTQAGAAFAILFYILLQKRDFVNSIL